MSTDSSILTLQVGVKAILKNTDDKYLLLRRNPDKYPEVGNIWDIPGGRIHTHTQLLENLKRELAEETGLILTDNPVILSAQDILLSDKHIVRITYFANISGEVKIDEESLEYNWFKKEDLKKLDNIDKYLKEVLEQSWYQI